MATVNNKEDRVNYAGNSGAGDIHISHRDYYDMIDPLLDERISPRMLMKFKNLYEINSWGMFAVPIIATPVALVLTKLLVGDSVLTQVLSTGDSATNVLSGPASPSSSPQPATTMLKCPCLASSTPTS